MATVVAAFGVIIAALGLLGAIAPGVMKAIASFFRRPGSHYVAAAVRFVLGLLLIIGGPYCRPEYYSQEIVRWFGVFTVAAGVLILLVGQNQLLKFIDWWLARPPLFMRLWAIIAILLGGYLVYASAFWQ